MPMKEAELQLKTASSPSFKGLKSSSTKATVAARAASRKTDTKCEVVLRRLLWRAGARYRKNVKSLPGTPDIVFPGPRLIVFCDGDFWHGKDWGISRKKLSEGSNAGYWVTKIQRNRDRDRQITARLESAGWKVLRYWESEIHAHAESVALEILEVLQDLDKRPQAG